MRVDMPSSPYAPAAPTEAPSGELLWREADFLARRRRLLRALAASAASLGVGLLLLAVVRPALRDAVGWLVVLGFAGSGLRLAWIWRRSWRCPACEVRWPLGDVLASAHWNHCAACGAGLRASPKRAPLEPSAGSEPDTATRAQWLERFERRRRRRGAAALVATGLGAAALLLASAAGWGETARQVLVAALAGAVSAAAVWASRCPRCRVGVVTGPGRHCQRCGLRLRLAEDRDRSPRADGR